MEEGAKRILMYSNDILAEKWISMYRRRFLSKEK